MSKEDTVTSRIQHMLDHYGLNANNVAQKLGYATNSKMYKILQGTEPSFPTLVDMLRSFPDISSDWLTLGDGPMLRSEAGTVVATSGRAVSVYGPGFGSHAALG